MSRRPRHPLKLGVRNNLVTLFDRAIHALNKIDSATDSIRTADWYTHEIARLVSMNALIEALKEVGISSVNLLSLFR